MGGVYQRSIPQHRLGLRITQNQCDAMLLATQKKGHARSAQRTFQPLSFLQIHVLHIVDCVPQKHGP